MAEFGLTTPVTAGIEQSRVQRSNNVGRTDSANVIDRATQISTAANLDNQQSISAGQQAAATQPPATQTPVHIAKEQIRVTSTLGKGDIRGNLSPARAAEIYAAIAKLL